MRLLSFFVAALSVQQAVSFRILLDKRSNPDIGVYKYRHFPELNFLQYFILFYFILEQTVLGLALELEHLEVAFYSQFLSQFSATDFANANLSPLVYQRYQEILQHEMTHVDLLTAALGDNAPQPCNYFLYVFLFF